MFLTANVINNFPMLTVLSVNMLGINKKILYPNLFGFLGNDIYVFGNGVASLPWIMSVNTCQFRVNIYFA